MKSTVLQYAKNFLNLFYPNLCAGCENSLMQGEEGICLECMFKIPNTNFSQDENNPVAQIFWGRVKVKRAFALYYYTTGGIFQKIIHSLKYKNDTIVGIVLGKQLGHEINKIPNLKIDVLVPVPLHVKKLKKRGYNQCDFIIKGIQEVLDIESNNSNLLRIKYSDSQTKRQKYERWENAMNSFIIRNAKLFENKHVLLIDDIVTTGATLEACATALLECNGCSVSIACLGKAD